MTTVSALPTEKAPFVNGSTIRQYVGKKVFIAGKVISLREGTLLVQTSDQQQLQIFGSRCTVGEGVPILCLVFVSPNGTATEIQTFPAGNNFDLNLYEEVSKFCNGPFASLF
ncbi:hypothetical protein GpartN1_g5905.t1 [Galdieria partita]|uniref:Replication factor A protein 3 n=1 Tax=Galdieria partita TaxID=83374 RepID=A0A9C7Q0Q5_9RHOD|nr:hypothetical protein GpartN1_g5905.t1 [Galdieria partita]